VKHAVDAEVRLYDRLFINENPDEVDDDSKDFKSNLNPDSLKIVTGKIEPAVMDMRELEKFQFQRLGYFCVDKDSTDEKPVFNRTVTLRDSWAKKNK
jgi:glutaminyl-tRNA synthetase